MEYQEFRPETHVRAEKLASQADRAHPGATSVVEQCSRDRMSNLAEHRALVGLAELMAVESSELEMLTYQYALGCK